jgi:hypothetical protein
MRKLAYPIRCERRYANNVIARNSVRQVASSTTPKFAIREQSIPKASADKGAKRGHITATRVVQITLVKSLGKAETTCAGRSP